MKDISVRIRHALLLFFYYDGGDLVFFDRSEDSKVLATFIGRDGSMGLVNGKQYSILVSPLRKGFLVEWGMYGRCPYDTMKGLLKNWKF